jgi:hypothetical protein
MKVLTENHEEINLKDLTDDGDDVPVHHREKENIDIVDLGLDSAEETETFEEEIGSIFDDYEDAFDKDDGFQSSDLFDDFDDLDDLDSDDDEV